MLKWHLEQVFEFLILGSIMKFKSFHNLISDLSVFKIIYEARFVQIINYSNVKS